MLKYFDNNSILNSLNNKHQTLLSLELKKMIIKKNTPAATNQNYSLFGGYQQNKPEIPLNNK